MLRWQWEKTEVIHEALLAVDTRTTVHLTPTVLRYQTTLRYDVLQGRGARIRILLPSDQTLTRVEGEALRDWDIAAEVGGSVLSVEFLRPVESTTTLTLLTEQAVAGLPELAVLSVPQPLGVQRETGALSLVAEDVVARLEPTPGLRQVNAAAEELAAYRFSTRPVSLSVNLTRVEPIVQVTARVQAALEESRLWVRNELDLNVSSAGIYKLELIVPQGFTVADVTTDGLENWKVKEGVLYLGFGRRLLGERSIAVQLEQAFNTLPEQIHLRPLRLPEAVRATSLIGVRAVAGVNLKTTQVEGVREVSVAALPNHQDEQLAFRAETGDWQIVVSAETLAPRLVAEVFNLITLGDGLVGGSATVRYVMVNQGVTSLRIRLPAYWRNVEFTGPNLRRTEHQGDLWTLTL